MRTPITLFGLLLMLALLLAGCSSGGSGDSDNTTDTQPITLDSFQLDDPNFVLQ